MVRLPGMGSAPRVHHHQPGARPLRIGDGVGARQPHGRRAVPPQQDQAGLGVVRCAQGSQFTSARFTGLLLGKAIAVSMDARGAWRDNVFVARLGRSVKHEEVYLPAYGSFGEARALIGRYLEFYNRKRPHSSLDARTPDQAYFDHLPQRAAA